EMVERAADSLDLPRPAGVSVAWSRRFSILAPAAVVLLASMLAVGSATYLYERFANRTVEAASDGVVTLAPAKAAAADTHHTILVGSFPASDTTGVRALADWLQASGFSPSQVEVDLRARGR